MAHFAFFATNSACLISRASSTGRCNTIQCIDSAMLPRKNRPFGCTRPKSSQRSVPAGLTLASDFGFCFQCQVGSSLVLRRPIETTAFTRHYPFCPSFGSGRYCDLRNQLPWALVQSCAFCFASAICSGVIFSPMVASSFLLDSVPAFAARLVHMYASTKFWGTSFPL